MSIIQDHDNTSYVVSAKERPGGMIRYSVSTAHGVLIARLGYLPGQERIVSLWVDARYRRFKIAYALVKHVWGLYPQSVGRYPEVKMSPAMHGFLRYLMRREGLTDRVPPKSLRGRSNPR